MPKTISNAPFRSYFAPPAPTPGVFSPGGPGVPSYPDTGSTSGGGSSGGGRGSRHGGSSKAQVNPATRMYQLADLANQWKYQQAAINAYIAQNKIKLDQIQAREKQATATEGQREDTSNSRATAAGAYTSLGHGQQLAALKQQLATAMQGYQGQTASAYIAQLLKQQASNLALDKLRASISTALGPGETAAGNLGLTGF